MTLRATGTNTGKPEVFGELDVKSVINAEKGVVISGVGDDAATDCTYAGMVRYNSTKRAMQFCDGSTSKWADLSVKNNGSFSGTCPYNLSLTGPAEVGTPKVLDNAPACYCEKDKGDQNGCKKNRYTHFSFTCESPNVETGNCSCAGGEPVIMSYTTFGIPLVEGYKSATFVCR